MFVRRQRRFSRISALSLAEARAAACRLRFVSVMAAFAAEVRRGSAPGPYTHARAELFARLALIDDEQFEMLDANRLSDDLLAGHFGVPVEQIERKRQDLAASRDPG